MAAFFVILTLVIILSLAEAVMLFFVRHPNALRRRSPKFQNAMAYLYVQGERRVMQFLKGYGRYSPDFGYTLNPGVFVFAEREFSNRYFINSLGVRDSEEALTSPEIIVLGDSYALGWGVEQDETFAALLGVKSNLKVLNTSIPSFGTVREMLMLNKIDRSQLKYLIIQYCGDDYDENLKFYLNGNKPQIMRGETFHKLTEIHSRPKHYYFGKYVWMKIQKKIREASPAPPQASSLPSEADLFVHVLGQFQSLVEGLPTIVLDLGGKNRPGDFVAELKRKTSTDDHPAFLNNLIILDLTQHLNAAHFYVLDDHLTPEGHRVVADVIVRAMEKAGTP
jgi:hypothetical protein